MYSIGFLVNVTFFLPFIISQVAQKYKKSSKFSIVEVAHMELSEPSIATAFDQCIEKGANRIICHPFFLSPGRHVTEDIPRLMSEAAERHPGATYDITDPLGMQEEILSLIDVAIKKTL
jgi:sirohydrochlorin ferrochelatase